MKKYFSKFKKLGYISIEIVIIAAIMLVSGFTAVGSFVEDGQKATNDAASKIDETLNLAGGGEGAGPGGSGGGAGGGELPEIPDADDEKANAYALVLDNGADANNAVPMIFVREDEAPVAGETYKSETYGDLTITAVYSNVENLNAIYYFDIPWNTRANTITSVVVEDKITPKSTAYWFRAFNNTKSINLQKLDTSNVTNMNYMFQSFAREVETVNVDLSYLNTSKVKTMGSMFTGFASTSKNVNLNLSNWDLSSITDMSFMFDGSISNDIFTSSDEFTVRFNLTNWKINTSEPVSMQQMFYGVCSRTHGTIKELSIDGLNTWDVSAVTNMDNMFQKTGRNAPTFSLNLSDWDVRNVTSHIDFNTGVSSKVIAPTWAN